MKKNIFGLPIFRGLLLENKPEHEIVRIPVRKDINIACRNDLSLISITKDKVEEVTDFYTDLDEDTFSRVVGVLICVASKITTQTIADETMKDIMMYVVMSSSPVSCLKNLKANVSKESITLASGLGVFVD